MLAICKYALGPVLLAQGLRMRRVALRLPEAAGPREGRVGEPRGQPLRLLFLGDSSAGGVGVAQQNQALALPTAQSVAERLGVHVHWRLIAQSGVNTAEALQLLRRAPAEPADVLITALGVNDVTSQQSPHAFLFHYQCLVDEAVARTGVKAFVISGLPPMGILPGAPQPLRWYLGRYATRLDERLRHWCAGQENSVHLPMDWSAQPAQMAADGYHPGPSQYARWSALIAARVVELAARLDLLQSGTDWPDAAA